MPHRQLHRVIYCQGCGPSARALARSLNQAGYNGPLVNFGYAGADYQGAINEPTAVRVAANKREALRALQANDVNTPLTWYTQREAELAVLEHGTLIGRTTRHQAGSGCWICTNPADISLSAASGATHWLELIQPSREFRCHVAFGNSIKLTEKLYLPPGNVEPITANHISDIIRSHRHGWAQMHPQPGAHRISLRNIAKHATHTLALDFGAVDILTTPTGQHLVLEVNTAPNLTAATDTCQRYTTAIITNHQETHTA